MGLKNTKDWNRAQILHHLCRVIAKSNPIWPSWVNQTVLRHQHFWTMDEPTDCSWIWRKILKLGPIVLQFLTYQIGDGRNISLGSILGGKALVWKLTNMIHLFLSHSLMQMQLCMTWFKQGIGGSRASLQGSITSTLLWHTGLLISHTLLLTYTTMIINFVEWIQNH